jgi:putative inorganic carbon (HCO3(-)) transporter
MAGSREATPERGAGWWRPADLEPGVPDSPLPFWALFAFTFVLLVAPQSFLPVLAPLRIALLAAVVGVAAYLFDRLIHRRPVFRPSREMAITAWLLGWIILTLPFSYWPGGSISYLLDIYLKTLVVFWLLAHVVSDATRLRRIIWGLALMAVPIALAGVNNFLSGGFLHGGETRGPNRIVGYSAGLTENPNDLALMLNLILPLSVALLLASRKPAVRAALVAVIILDVIAIILTFSRAGFLTLAVSSAMYLWMLFKRGNYAAVLLTAVLAVAALPFLPSNYTKRLSTITDIEADASGSAQQRWADSLVALGYVAQHPVVGAGVGNNVLAMNEARGSTWIEVHNVYLQYAVDLGMPGLILFLMLVTACIRSAREAERRCAAVPESAELGHLAAGIRISLTGFVVAALFHPAGYQFYFYFIAGLAIAGRAIARDAAGERG